MDNCIHRWKQRREIRRIDGTHYVMRICSNCGAHEVAWRSNKVGGRFKEGQIIPRAVFQERQKVSTSD